MNFSRKTGKRIVVLENGLISTYTVRDGLMKELMCQGYEVYVLTHSNKFKDEVEQSGLKVIDVGSGNTNPFKIFSYIRKIYKSIKRLQPDLCLTFSVRPAIWGNLICRRFRIPVITNISGMGPLFTSRNFAYRFIRFIYPFALSKTSKVFFQNEEDRELFIAHQFVARNKTARIAGSGIDYEKFAPLPQEKSDGSEFSFLYIGRLIKDKGILEFIDAARILKSKYAAVGFKVIGPLWHQNLKSNLLSEHALNQWVDDGLITYEGEKKNVQRDIADTDCVVLPSYREGISNVLLESSSMEKPSIACNVTGCKEIIDHEVTGLLCNVKDAEDLARAMERMYLMNPFQRQEMGRKARQKVIREFDKKTVIHTYMMEIDKILSVPQLQYKISLQGSGEAVLAHTA